MQRHIFLNDDLGTLVQEYHQDECADQSHQWILFSLGKFKRMRDLLGYAESCSSFDLHSIHILAWGTASSRIGPISPSQELQVP